jgi:predicted transcriptional regulator
VKRQQITITISPDMLRRLDALAEQIGQTRAGLLLGAAQLLRDGI